MSNTTVSPGLADRRSFLSWMGLAWIAFVAALGNVAAMSARFFFPNVLFEPPSVFLAGTPDELRVGEVDRRFKESHKVWLVRDEEGIYALLAVCTHLGCTPNWLPEDQKFKCPCHGSGFYKSGINFEGPAPRPLERVEVSLTADGQIEIDKSRTFQFEKNEWGLPGAKLDL